LTAGFGEAADPGFAFRNLLSSAHP
jgi:hypothetical protein